jgi:hypothetical protein
MRLNGKVTSPGILFEIEKNVYITPHSAAIEKGAH